MKKQEKKSLTVGGFLLRHHLANKITRRKAEHILKNNINPMFYKDVKYSYRILSDGYVEFLNTLLEYSDSAEGKNHAKQKIHRLGRNRSFEYLKSDLKQLNNHVGLDLIYELSKLVLKYKIRPVDLITKIDAKGITHKNTKFYTLYKTKIVANQKNRDELNINDMKHEYILHNRNLYYRNK